MALEIVSPRVRDVVADVASGVAGAVQKFWDEVTSAGTPLVEPAPDSETHRLVTFLWRFESRTTTVHLHSPLGSRPVRLEALPGSDIGYVTYRVRRDLRLQYWVLVDAPPEVLEADDWTAMRPYRRCDPLNPRSYFQPAHDLDPDAVDTLDSVVELDGAPEQPWLEPRDAVPRGSLAKLVVDSAILGNTRRVWLYTPPNGRESGEPLGLVVLLDGWVWAQAVGIGPTLDGLIADGRIPPLVVVMPEERPGKERWKEYGLDESYLRFLTDELLPLVRTRGVIHSDPARTVIAGQSLGGLTAAFAGLRRPDVFGNVLSQSGSFWWSRRGDVDVQAGRLTREYASATKVPVAFYVEVGLLEGRDMVAVNRHFRDVLTAQGYDLTYVEYNGGHSWLHWRGSLADGLIALTASWPRP